MNKELYRDLAAAGNKHAARIADELVMVPAGTSEEEGGVAELEAKIAELVATAAAHLESGDCMRAADAQIGMAARLEQAGLHQRAMDAYKAAAMSLFKHVDGCGYAQGYSLPQIRAIHAGMK